MVNSTIELGKRDEEVSAYVNGRVSMSLELFEGIIRRAQATGEITSKSDPAGLAGTIVMGVHGLKAMSRLDVGKAVLEPAVEELLKLLE